MANSELISKSQKLIEQYNQPKLKKHKYHFIIK